MDCSYHWTFVNDGVFITLRFEIVDQPQSSSDQPRTYLTSVVSNVTEVY